MTCISQQQFESLTTGAGFVELQQRTLVVLSGQDRQRVLHNFCTANINTLPPGQSTETFVLNEKGKLLWHGLVLAMAEELWLTSAGDYAQMLIAHLDKYVIRDDVRFSNRSQDFASLFATGVAAKEKLNGCLSKLPERNEVQMAAIIESIPLIVAHVEIAGWGYLLLVARSEKLALEGQLKNIGVVACELPALHALRIEQRTPWFGIDMDESNLPQELHRDEKAISFTKGCYLGQETVARIDAIGHVNQRIVGVRIQSEQLPTVGQNLISEDGKSVGRLTSVAQLPDGQIVGLAMVRRGVSKGGTELKMEKGTAEVIPS